MIQLLGALKYMHSAGVIHRDLNPANVLVDDDGSVTVIDFNLARTDLVVQSPITGRYGQRKMSCGVGTKNYTPPEVLWPKILDRCETEYGVNADVWQAGLIMANMLGVHPMDLEEVNQCLDDAVQFAQLEQEVEDILAFVGLQEEDIPDAVKEWDAEGKKFLRQYTGKWDSEVISVCRGAPKEAGDLLRKMLVFNPDQRMSVQEAIDHPYFDSVRRKYSKNINKVSPFTISLDFEFGDEAEKTVKIWHRIYTACLEFNRIQAGYGGLSSRGNTVFGTLHPNE